MERGKSGLTKELMALRVAKGFRDGDYVNIGYGLPNQVINFIPQGMDIFLHAENGMLGYGGVAEEDKWDSELINPGAIPVTLMPGASFSDTSLSFGIMRGRHLDLAILGAYQVSERGDLANWKLPSDDKIGAIGGAMDVAVGTKRVLVVMWHMEPSGKLKIVKECNYPLTAKGVVNTIITDIAVIEVTPQGLLLLEVAPGFIPEEVQAVTEPKLLISDDIKEMEF